MASADNAVSKQSGPTSRGIRLLLLCLYRDHDQPCTVLSAVQLSAPESLTVILGLHFCYTDETPELNNVLKAVQVARGRGRIRTWAVSQVPVFEAGETEVEAKCS